MQNEIIIPWDEFHEECKMTIEEFIKDSKLGCISDDDGYGVYANDEGYTKLLVYPSSVLHNWLRTDFPYVCWFNK